MLIRWNQGTSTIQALLDEGRLQNVQPDRSLADVLLKQAELHIETARTAAASDVVGAFQLAYDAARKALASVLQIQGLRPTAQGGHLAIEEALRAQLVPPMGKSIDSFGWLRSLRNRSEYPDGEAPSASDEDTQEALVIARDLIDVAAKLLEQMPPWG